MEAYSLTENDNANPEGTANSDTSVPSTPAKTPKGKARASTGRKRKVTSETPDAPGAEINGNADGDVDTPTKPKRQRKPPAKKKSLATVK
jgi:hypothetical protein